MDAQNQRGFFGIIITKEILEDMDLTIAEKFIYGYIASFTKCCYESNEKIADKLGVSKSVVAHAIPKLAEKGYLFIEKVGNNSAARRIYSVMDNPKKLAYLAKNGMLKSFPQGVEKSADGVQNMHTPVQNMHSLVQNMHSPKTGVSSAKFAHKEKNKIRIKEQTEQDPNKAGSCSVCKIRRQDYPDDKEYVDEFYRRNTVHLGAN